MLLRLAAGALWESTRRRGALMTEARVLTLATAGRRGALGVDPKMWRILAMSLVIAPGQVGEEGQTSLLAGDGGQAGALMTHMGSCSRD